MQNLPASSFESYLSGARSARAKSIGAVAIGATALVAFPSEADAQVTVVPLSGANSMSFGGSSLYFSLETGVGSTSNFAGAQFRFVASTETTYYGGDGLWSGVYTLNGGFGSSKIATTSSYQAPVTKFSFGQTIGSGSLATNSHGAPAEFNRYGGNVTPTWTGATGYLGVSFQNITGTHYGWIKVQTNGNASTITVLAAAFEATAGQSITAGASAVPEPATSAALLALGAAGLVAYRQRKKIQRAA